MSHGTLVCVLPTASVLPTSNLQLGHFVPSIVTLRKNVILAFFTTMSLGPFFDTPRLLDWAINCVTRFSNLYRGYLMQNFGCCRTQRVLWWQNYAYFLCESGQDYRFRRNACLRSVKTTSICASDLERSLRILSWLIRGELTTGCAEIDYTWNMVAQQWY